jgi:nucleoside-diphosphate-sugar epimerase
MRQQHLKKFLSFSTSEVYGSDAEAPEEHEPAIIRTPFESRWCYAASKTLSEHLIMAYHREQGLPSIIIRPFNVFGEYRFGANAMTTFIRKAIHGEEILIHGSGKQVRTWCYISDFIDGVYKALISNITGEIFNIGNPHNQITVLDLAKLVVTILNSKSECIITNSAQPDVLFRTVNIEKAQTFLQYNPVVSLHEGITNVSEWMKQNEC